MNFLFFSPQPLAPLRNLLCQRRHHSLEARVLGVARGIVILQDFVGGALELRLLRSERVTILAASPQFPARRPVIIVERWTRHGRVSGKTEGRGESDERWDDPEPLWLQRLYAVATKPLWLKRLYAVPTKHSAMPIL